jgi:hypothetical protein
MQSKLWRIFGVLAIADIAVMFAGIAVEGMTPELGSSHHNLVKGLTEGGLTTRFAGGYVEALSSIVFLFAALLLARLVRGTTETTGWLASVMSATAVLNAGSALIVGFPAGAAAIYDGHHGASLDVITTMNDLRNFAFFLSVALLGVFTICAGVALLATRTMPRWLAWAGVVVGALSVVSVAGAGSGAHNLGNMAQMIWWVVLAVYALRSRVVTNAASPTSHDAVLV